MTKRNKKKVHFKEKNSTRKFKVADKACADRAKERKESPDPNWNKRRGALRARPHPAKPIVL